ncbi:MAG: molecular chaperone TorD family protein [Chromatiaceae bacterium]|nr:molecular chaperone TorD family protein [Chromatiaceae bacterium]
MSEQSETGRDSLSRFFAAVADDLTLLVDLHDRELDRERLILLRESSTEDSLLGFMPPGEGLAVALSLFTQGLTDIPADLHQRTLDLLAADYADIYLNHGIRASPCESVWIDADGLILQEPMFQIRHWYRRYGLVVQDWRKRSDDHLVCQLGFLSYLFRGEADVDVLGEVARFLDEHLLRWISDFAERVGTRSGTRLYGGLALLTAAYLDGLRDTLAEVLGEPRPTPAEIAERMRPKLAVAPEPPGRFVPGTAPSW